MTKDHDPIETLEELIGKKDALNPMKAIDKVKTMLMAFAFLLGMLPLAMVGLVKVMGPILIIGGLILLCKGIRLLWNRSRRL